jgi:hypothetical protein
VSEVPTPIENHLLAALPPDVREGLFPRLELTSLVLGGGLYESEDTLSHVYFPTDSIESLIYVMENEASGEISVVDNEGVPGIALFLAGDSTEPPRFSWRLVGVSHAAMARPGICE